MNELKKRREALGLTQKQVAERIGIKEQQYQKYERGANLPSLKIAIMISKALESTVEDLYGGLVVKGK